MLARAFQADPVASYLFPEERGREEALRRFFSVQLEQNYLTRGEVWVEGSLRAAALWMPPEPRPASFSDLRIHFGLLAVLRGRLGVARRLARLLAARHPREAHYYLGTLGTEPVWQRRGIATSLVEPVLERCDARSLPAYLESSRLENVGFYEARGFRVVDEVSLDGGPTLWLMWRTPLERPASS